MSAPTITSIRNAALELAARGLRVIPCRARTKEPLFKEWQRKATTDVNTICGWWASRPYNIAIATGEASGVWALDIDGDAGEGTLLELENRHGKLPPTVEVITGDDGRHLYWRWPTGVEIRNRQERADIPSLHVRGTNGYCLAPPSVHPNTGREYAWSVDSSDTFADAPAWLIDLVVRNRASKPITVTSPDAWCSFLNTRVEGSHRGSAIARLSGMLLRRYVHALVALDLVRFFNALRCDPPLEDNEVVEIITSILRREKERRGGLS
jgi:hypothetical protein